MRIVGGIMAVLVVSLIGGVAGHMVGHWWGEGEKNIALQSALIGAVAGALVSCVVIVSLAQRGKDWFIAVGAIIAAVFELLAIAFMIWQRRV